MKSKEVQQSVDDYGFFIRDLARVQSISFIPEEAPRPKRCALAVTAQAEVYVPLEGVIDIDKEKDRLFKQIAKMEKELEGKTKKLSNPGFLEKADPEVVAEQRQIKEELEFKLEKLLKARELLEG
jgi:valyl-tRNA synthetase